MLLPKHLLMEIIPLQMPFLNTISMNWWLLKTLQGVLICPIASLWSNVLLEK